jgi:glycosyltransferase involved in cell wall biosynthesis
MKISIIIPTHNNENEIIRSIRSALEQSVYPTELIVVDDGSGDQTKDVLLPFIDSKKITYIFQKNKGQGAARNTGIAAAKGEWIAFLDADDVWMPNKLETQVALIQKRPEVDLWYTNAIIIKDGQPIGTHYPDFAQFPDQDESMYCRLIKTNVIINSSVMVKRQVFDEVGGFDEAPHLRRIEDYDLWLRLALKHTLAGTRDVLLHYLYPLPANQDPSTIQKGLKRLYFKHLWLAPLWYKRRVYQMWKKVS